MKVKMELLGSGTCEGLPKTPLLDRKGKLINAWKGSKRQTCPGNRVQGKNYPQTAGDRESAVQEKPGEGRARQGLSPSVGDTTEIPTKSRNPYTHGSQCWQGQTVVAENLFSDGKTSLGVERPVGTHTELLQIHSHHFQSWTTAENQEKLQLVLDAAFLSRAHTDSDVRFSVFPSPAKEKVRKNSYY